MHRWPEGAGRGDLPAFALADSEDNSVWGVCADVSGLFVEPPVRSYQLLACAPAGPLRDALGGAPGAGGGAPQAPWPLGELWLRPLGDDRCPEGSERLDAWQLEDVRVIGHRPHPGDPSLVDVFIEGADGYPDPPDDPYLAAGLLLHDGREHLGTCADFSDIVAPDDDRSAADAPLCLLGCAPGDRLRSALAAGTRRRLRLEEAMLLVLDRNGAEDTYRYVHAEIADWKPSPLGPGLLDIRLTQGLWDPPPPRARPLWQRWYDGPPTAPNQWAGYGTGDRELWLDCVRERGRGPAVPAAPPGRVYEVDGRHITDVPGLYLALGEAMRGPGGYFGGNADALDDCLCGGFGVTTPCTLVWHDAQVARRSLQRVLDSQGEPYSYFDLVLEVLRERRVEVRLMDWA
ncbi:MULTISPECIES: barstar family protein [unclassified Streptomyces]|uniref:barstar family protein n=1 Tax=unclassified Streptomyces TaxID=2593676 RepID=UPI00336A47B3